VVTVGHGTLKKFTTSDDGLDEYHHQRRGGLLEQEKSMRMG